MRGDTLAALEILRPRVYHCFEAGALATGCKLEIIGGEKPYSISAILHESVEKSHPVKENKIEINIEIPEDLTNNTLTSVQEVLYNFISKQVSEGKTIKEAENILESGLSEGLYKESDILLAVNQALRDGINKRDIRALNLKKKKEEKAVFLKDTFKLNDVYASKAETVEEQRFIDFLVNNPSHKESTVEIYKQAGLSSRKGNILKNKLLKNGIIKIKEERSNKGWKKIIRLNTQIKELN